MSLKRMISDVQASTACANKAPKHGDDDEQPKPQLVIASGLTPGVRINGNNCKRDLSEVWFIPPMASTSVDREPETSAAAASESSDGSKSKRPDAVLELELTMPATMKSYLLKAVAKYDKAETSPITLEELFKEALCLSFRLPNDSPVKWCVHDRYRVRTPPPFSVLYPEPSTIVRSSNIGFLLDQVIRLQLQSGPTTPHTLDYQNCPFRLTVSNKMFAETSPMYGVRTRAVAVSTKMFYILTEHDREDAGIRLDSAPVLTSTELLLMRPTVILRRNCKSKMGMALDEIRQCLSDHQNRLFLRSMAEIGIVPHFVSEEDIDDMTGVESDADEVESDADEVESDADEVESDAAEVESDAAEVESDAAEAEAEPDADEAEAESDANEAEAELDADEAEAESDANEAEAEPDADGVESDAENH